MNKKKEIPGMLYKNKIPAMLYKKRIPAMLKNYFIYFLLLLFIPGIVLFSGCAGKETITEKQRDVLYYTCGMHPSLRVSVEEYEKGKTKCPICHMDLVPVHKEEVRESETVEIVTVKISERERILAGVATEKIIYRHLFNEIITVGVVAYDPELLIAQEEYITALKTYLEIQKSPILESKERAEKLLSQSKYRLKLLGFNESLIDELKERKKPHTNLIFPEKTVWVYADVYEFEIAHIKAGQSIEVEAIAYPGEIFKGEIKAIDPVLNPKTRSIRVRAEILNPNLKLKPNMFVQVRILADVGKVLSVPRDAVLDTGMRKIVYIDLGGMSTADGISAAGGGEYALREIRVGTEATAIKDGVKTKFYPVRHGLNVGDLVVTRANFLIDSQSQLTGPAAAAFGGALGEEDEEKMPSGHQH